MTLFRGPSGHEYVIVSSQGDYTYSAYDASRDDRWVGSFRAAPGGAIDGTEETDGIATLATPLGSAFPHGIFVAQDGYNVSTGDGDRTDTNYKFVDLSDVLRALHIC